MLLHLHELSRTPPGGHLKDNMAENDRPLAHLRLFTCNNNNNNRWFNIRVLNLELWALETTAALIREQSEWIIKVYWSGCMCGHMSTYFSAALQPPSLSFFVSAQRNTVPSAPV